ncbi:hypothetical protein BDR06DRAFT_55957 [Suillus hirtellus]|nr:hypothetical protein BDR06DRAFT_55957 [Suillus hirtellus]
MSLCTAEALSYDVSFFYCAHDSLHRYSDHSSTALVACRHAYEDGEITHGSCFIQLEIMTTVDRCAEFQEFRSNTASLVALSQLALPVEILHFLGILSTHACTIQLSWPEWVLYQSLSTTIARRLLYHLFKSHVGKELSKAVVTTSLIHGAGSASSPL